MLLKSNGILLMKLSFPLIYIKYFEIYSSRKNKSTLGKQTMVHRVGHLLPPLELFLRRLGRVVIVVIH